ncbi:hypothetical protein GCM10011289_35420 [Paludibacterium paludis]|uniref:Uncharacterized protein n=1 Tax=Paludibacterium paludis TaxID=1225769 RepID=A0A918P640_9NEIS|nr:hypothetical protein GCM10011289_35420 [Paludibacterium paludis]
MEKFTFAGEEVQTVKLIKNSLLPYPKRESNEQRCGLGAQAQGSSLFRRQTFA